jgi:hypothetical protein
MTANDYHFVTYWRIPGTVADVAEVLRDAPGLARWWPSVYLSVTELEPGRPDGLDKVVAVHTKGWLPYTLRWQARVSEVHTNGYTLEASGDLAGRGIWTFMQDGREVLVIYDWKIRADKPLLRNLSFVVKPLLAWNHDWAMARGEESLKLEMARRRAAGAAERALIPAPPAPAQMPHASLLMAGAAGLAGLLWLFRGRRGRAKK